MKRTLRLFVILTFILGNAHNSQAQFSKIQSLDYQLDILVDYEEKTLISSCKLTIRNNSGKSISSIPFIIYRLLNILSVKNSENTSLTFEQRVTSFEDWAPYQVNAFSVNLNKSLADGDSTILSIDYKGHLLGYAETGLKYVKDQINKEFTIIRPDCLAYPIIGEPKFSTLKSTLNESFSYTTSVKVPTPLIVVNGGKLIYKEINDDYSTFVHTSHNRTWRIDIAISNYLTQTDGQIHTHFFEKDSIEGLKVHKHILNAMNLFSKKWGTLTGEREFSLIEIPEGYGSQASENYILQTAAAFRNPEQLMEVYHEISHLWNVKPNGQYPPRLNEGLATFMQYLMAEKIEGALLVDDASERIYSNIKNNNEYGDVALADYGKYDMTMRSYNVGFLFFHILYEVVGEKLFDSIISSFYMEYNQSGANTEQFMQQIKKVSKMDLDTFLNDWIYTTKFFQKLKKTLLYERIDFPISNQLK